uniref:N-acyl-aliphatic-L-amino acid amidohydrolase n=1 Tax=Heliothis virescens TaxID=7102 RepID=A0A2A4JVA2_HELVI
MATKWDDDEVVQRFREYLKIPSVHPDIDYGDCVKFLQKQASQLDLPVAVYEPVPNKPVVVITWEGLQPNLPSILLNSHMDVVPVYEEFWTYPPFGAVITEDGYIYARGTQDMKSIGMMHLESVRRLKNAGVRLKRTVHISFVPDEEIGGVDGMRAFSLTPEFKNLNIGFGLDESAPSQHPSEIIAFYGERTSRQIIVTCRGEPGHGSLLNSGTAGEKLHYIIDKFMTLRAEEKKRAGGSVWVGEVTTINLTQISGGVQINVLPESLSVSFDIRIAPEVDHDEFDKMISKWCEEAGEGVSFEYIVKNPQVKSTKIDGSVPFWDVMKKVVTDMGLSVKCVICPGATDARYVRAQGIPAINFSPIMNSPMLLHAHDEKIHVDVFKKGIDVIEKVVEAVANV